MKLPFLNKKKEDTGFYLALLLTDEKASAVILREELGKVKIIGTHEEFFSTPLEHVHIDELIEVVDKALSRAEEVLPPSIETHNTVFGVKESWVEEDTKKIKKHHLTQLKRVCDSLDLTPIGFMVTNEAISHLLQEEEGAPLSAIMAEITKTGVNLTLLRGGKKVETVQGPFKEFTPPVTVDMLLRHFTVPVLPARLILSDIDSTEKLSQQFIAHQWSKGLPFLHVPQITVLPAGFDARAVAFGAAAQMGFELVGLDTDLPKTIPAHQAGHTAAEQELPEDLPEEVQEDEKEHEENEIESTSVQADNFGFVTDQDIAEVTPAAKEPITEHPKTHHPEPSAHHAFPAADEEVNPHVVKHHQPDEEDTDDEEPEEHGKKAGPLAFLSGIKLPAMDNIKGLNVSRLGKNKKVLIPVLAVAGLIIGITAFSLFYLYQAEATVELTMRPNMVNQTTKTVFSTSDSSDFSKNIIAVRKITVTVDGEATTDATGKKDVGEKAKGTVTIFNNSGDKTTLKSGTEIKSGNGLVFLLDKDVNIGSASGDIFSGTKPGTADVSVVAKDIGTEQNLPSNTKFTIGGNSSLAAKNDSAFSGGTKKSVTVVSQKDLAKLRTDLPKSLQNKAKAAVAQKAESNETVLPYFATNSLEKATFDKKVDEEAKKVKLTASVVFDGMAYDNKDLEEYAKEYLERDQSGDVSLANNSIKAVVKETKEKGNDEMEATVELQGGVLPKLDTTEVAEGIQGKSYGDAKDKLNNLPQIASSNITFSPGIPVLPQFFPSLPKKIKVIIKSQ